MMRRLRKVREKKIFQLRRINLSDHILFFFMTLNRNQDFEENNENWISHEDIEI
jgi:hypothetical protein